MTKTRKIAKWVLSILFFLYLCLCGFYYFSQEKVLFNTSAKLKPDHVFQFKTPFEERYITMPDKKNSMAFSSKQKTQKDLFYGILEDAV